MSYEYEGAHNYEAPHNPKTHNRGEPYRCWYNIKQENDKFKKG